MFSFDCEMLPFCNDDNGTWADELGTPLAPEDDGWYVVMTGAIGLGVVDL